jgi:hypothetical protein
VNLGGAKEAAIASTSYCIGLAWQDAGVSVCRYSTPGLEAAGRQRDVLNNLQDARTYEGDVAVA